MYAGSPEGAAVFRRPVGLPEPLCGDLSEHDVLRKTRFVIPDKSPREPELALADGCLDLLAVHAEQISQ